MGYNQFTSHQRKLKLSLIINVPYAEFSENSILHYLECTFHVGKVRASDQAAGI